MNGNSVQLWAALSHGMGMASVGIWLCAQMPQVWKNYRRKSVEGLSVGFLLAWIIGDAANLAGCLMTDQLGFQTVLASYYVAMDMCLTIQFWLYRKQSHLDDEISPVYTTNVYNYDNSNRRDSSNDRESKFMTARRRLASFVSMTTLAGSLGRASAMPVAQPGSDIMAESVEVDLGFVLAYVSMAMYLISRVPQLLHNFERKSTSGVSILLFMSAFMGNLTYTLSILLSPPAMVGEHRRQFLVRELSYILGASGTMVFDLAILLQSFIYRKGSEDEDDYLTVTEVIHSVEPTMQNEDFNVQRLRQLVQRKGTDKTPLLAHQSIYST